MPFAPLVGVNNHGKTILFGAALLKGQTKDTFKWLLESFKAAMDGKEPDCIITDQDKAMWNAIRDIFPNVVHRFCYWHIMKNLREKQKSYFKAHGNMYQELKYVVENSFTIQEFLGGWKAILDKNLATDNNYLNNLWNIREYWVPAYFTKSFFPFSSTTGRSESTNSLFKSYVMHKDSAVKFFDTYQLIQEKNLSTLDRWSYKTSITERNIWSQGPFEKEISQIYTRDIFVKFQTELRNSSAYGVCG